MSCGLFSILSEFSLAEENLLCYILWSMVLLWLVFTLIIKPFIHNNLNNIKLKSTADLREQADFFNKDCTATFTFLPFLFNKWWKLQCCHKITFIYSDKGDANPRFITLISGHTNTMKPDMPAASLIIAFQPTSELMAGSQMGWAGSK